MFTMAPITKEVILSDLDRLKLLINGADHKFNIIPKEIEKLVSRYETIFKKWKSGKVEKYQIVAHHRLPLNCVIRVGLELWIFMPI